jgi:hypothetical protein
MGTSWPSGGRRPGIHDEVGDVGGARQPSSQKVNPLAPLAGRTDRIHPWGQKVKRAQPVWTSNQTASPSRCRSTATPQRVARAAISPRPRPRSSSQPARRSRVGGCGLWPWTSTRTAGPPADDQADWSRGVCTIALVTSSPASSTATSIRASTRHGGRWLAGVRSSAIEAGGRPN